MCFAIGAGMRKTLLGCLLSISLVPACGNVVVENPGATTTTTGSQGGGSGEGGGPVAAGGGVSTGGSGGSGGAAGGGGQGGTGTGGDGGKIGSPPPPMPCVLEEEGTCGGVVSGMEVDGTLTLLGIAIDGAGNTIVAGAFSGAVSLGETVLQAAGFSVDAFIAKLDAGQNVLWAHSFGTADDDWPRGVAVGEGDGIYWATSSQGLGAATSTLHRFGGDGALLWETKLPVVPVSTQAVSVTPGGGAVVAGVAVGPVDIGDGPLPDHPGDLAVLRYSAGGDPLWAAWADFPAGNNYGGMVAVDAEGQTFVGAHRYDGLAVSKLSPDGQGLWVWSTVDASAVEVQHLATDAAGNVFVAGWVGLHVDFGDGPVTPNGAAWGYLLKLDGEGQPAWYHVLRPGPDVQDYLRGIVMAVDADGSARIGGHYHGALESFGAEPFPTADDHKLFHARFHPNGALSWSHAPEGSLGADVSENDAAVAPDGSLRVLMSLTGDVGLLDGDVFSAPQLGAAILTVAP